MSVPWSNVWMCFVFIFCEFCELRYRAFKSQQVQRVLKIQNEKTQIERFLFINPKKVYKIFLAMKILLKKKRLLERIIYLCNRVSCYIK